MNDIIMDSIKNTLGENSIGWNRIQKNQMILEELKGWLQMGIQCLGSDYTHSESEEIRLDEKVSTMKMVLYKIDELERSL